MLPKGAKHPGPSQTEITLRLELESLEADLGTMTSPHATMHDIMMCVCAATARQEVDVARKQNDWLASELRQMEDEIAHYERLASQPHHTSTYDIIDTAS